MSKGEIIIKSKELIYGNMIYKKIYLEVEKNFTVMGKVTYKSTYPVGDAVVMVYVTNRGGNYMVKEFLGYTTTDIYGVFVINVKFFQERDYVFEIYEPLVI